MLRIAGRRVGEERVAARSADDLVGVAGAEHPVVAFAGTKRRVARSLTVGQGDMIAAAERVEGGRGERMEKIEVVQVDDIQAFGEARKRIVALGHNGRSYIDAARHADWRRSNEVRPSANARGGSTPARISPRVPRRNARAGRNVGRPSVIPVLTSDRLAPASGEGCRVERPRWRRGGTPGDGAETIARSSIAAFLYAYSLGIALALLFVVSFVLHLLGSAATNSAEAAQNGEAPLGLGRHLVGGAVLVRVVPELAVGVPGDGSPGVLSIFLRFRGSPESKRIDASNEDTGR